MSGQPAEQKEIHTRIMKCALEVEESRAYWNNVAPGAVASAETAFADWWFGSKSLDRVKVLLANFRARFDAFPQCLAVLHGWTGMDPVTRALICHWHLQLADPLYRALTGSWLVERREHLRPAVTRDLVVAWVAEHGRERWTLASRIQIASKLLSAAYAAGLVASNRDPRPLVFPRVGDDALSYLLYLLRGVSFRGTLTDNPYLRSVGLSGADLDDRLRGLSGLSYRRQMDLVDMDWRFPDLPSWARAEGLISGEGSGKQGRGGTP